MANEEGLALIQQNKPTLTQLVLVNMPAGTLFEDAERLALKEISNLELQMSNKPELLKCDPNSILLAIKQCIGDNLTLAPSAGLVYLYPGKVCIGKDGANQKIYKEVLTYDPTANGRLSIARQCGRILDNRRPVCTFDEKGAVTSVTVEFLVPSYPNPRWEVITFSKPYFEKWKQKSASKFGNTANANYTSFNGGIDPEFAGSKAIRHGLSKLGVNMNEKRNAGFAMDFKPISQTAIQKDTPEAETEDVPHTIVQPTVSVDEINTNDLM